MANFLKRSLQDARTEIRLRRRLIALPLSAGAALAMDLLQEQFQPPSEHRRLAEKWKNHWAKVVVPLAGIDIRLLGEEPSILDPFGPKTRARMIVANHRSPFDVMVLMHLFSGHFLANDRTADIPIVGACAKKVETIFVDRDDQKSGTNSVRHMRRLLSEKRTVLVFPEGTTYAGDEVRPFKSGAFVAANGLDVEVVPVGLAWPMGYEFTEDSLGDYAKRTLRQKKIPVVVAIGKPMPVPDRKTGGGELARAAVQNLVLQARAASIHG